MTQFPSKNEQLTLAVVIPLHLFAGKGAGQGGETIPTTVTDETKQNKVPNAQT